MVIYLKYILKIMFRYLGKRPIILLELFEVGTVL